jgi:hypothetical protein
MDVPHPSDLLLLISLTEEQVTHYFSSTFSQGIMIREWSLLGKTVEAAI